MASESWLEIAIGVGALALLGVAAVVEAVTGLVGQSRPRHGHEGTSGRRRTLDALVDPRRSLTASLFVLQALALMIAALAFDAVLRREIEGAHWLLTLVIVTAAYLVLGQSLPRALSRYRHDESVGLLHALVVALTVPVRPLVIFAAMVGRWLARLLPPPPPEPVGSREEELRAIINADTDSGIIEPEERQMIDAALRLEELTVREIMVPRVDMIAVPEDIPTPELVDVIVGAGHSRIPVYRESIDQVVGVLHAKDLLPHLLGADRNFVVAEHLRKPHIVPESKHLDVLLKEMRRERQHLAVVADEYGGTAGLVTIEDILEEIVGEIQDEYDTEAPLFELIGPNELLADGRLPLEDVENAFGMRFPEDVGYESVGGFVQTALGRLPREGDRFEDEGIEGEILAVEGRRVRRLRLAKVQEGRDADGEAERRSDGEMEGESDKAASADGVNGEQRAQ